MACFILALALTACDSKPRESIKGKATDFSLKDINGKDVRLSDFRGKVVMLDFWATWCPPCVNAVPELAALHTKYNSKGFEVIGISMDHSVGDTKRFVAGKNVPYTMLMSSDKVEKQYGVTTIPVSFLIDKSGKVVRKHLGFAPGVSEEIEKEIRLLIEDIPLKKGRESR
jgi:peroxiredoxin